MDTVPVGVPLAPETVTVTDMISTVVTGCAVFTVTPTLAVAEPVPELQYFTSCVASTLPSPVARS